MTSDPSIQDLIPAPSAAKQNRDPDVPVFVGQRPRSWPKYAKGGRARYMKLSKALELSFDYDAHFLGYSVPAIERRLSKAAIGHARLPDGVPMQVLAFDFDDTVAKSNEQPARSIWRAANRAGIDALGAVQPGGFFYTTYSGSRIVYLLPEPVIIRAVVDAATWREFYLGCVERLRDFGLDADRACNDWQRFFRLPRIKRTGKQHEPEVIGNSSALGFWTLAPAPISHSKRSTGAKALGRTPYDIGDDDDVVVLALEAAGLLGALNGTDMYGTTCPFSSGHSKTSSESSTVVYRANGMIVCKHSSCAARTQREFRAQIATNPDAASVIARGGSERALHGRAGREVERALAARVARSAMTLCDSRLEMYRLGSERLKNDGPPRVVAGTVGAGKSTVAVELLEDFGKGILVCDNHGNAAARASELRSRGIRVFHQRSIADKASRSLCTQPDRLANVLTDGLAAFKACMQCPDRNGCSLRERDRPEYDVLVGCADAMAHHIDRLRAQGIVLPVIVDEQPALHHQDPLPRLDDELHLVGDMGGIDELRRCAKKSVKAARAIARVDGNVIARALVDRQRAISEDVTRKGLFVETKDGQRRETARTPLAKVLEWHPKTVCFTATPDEVALKAIRPDLEISYVVVEPVVAPRRYAVATWGASKSRLISDGKPAWDRLVPLVRVALKRASAEGVTALLLVTWKNIADALRGTEPNPVRAMLDAWGAKDSRRVPVTFAHYWAVTGSNDHQDRDGLITLGDPHLDVDELRRQAKELGLSEEQAAERAEALVRAQLEQAGGRLRWVFRGGVHIHVGRRVPFAWSSETVVEVLPIGRPKREDGEPDPELDALRAGLASWTQDEGQQAVADKLKVPRTTIRDVVRMGKRPGHDLRSRLRAALRAREGVGGVAKLAPKLPVEEEPALKGLSAPEFRGATHATERAAPPAPGRGRTISPASASCATERSQGHRLTRCVRRAVELRGGHRRAGPGGEELEISRHRPAACEGTGATHRLRGRSRG